MQRNDNESFADYKVRRAASNMEVRMLNYSSKGGKVGAREQRRSLRASQRARGVGITRAPSTRRSAGAAHATYQALH